MKRKVLFALLALVFGRAYSQINHWETAVNAGDTWRYFRGVSAPVANWNTLAFSAGTWSQGPGGIGFGDDDDQTTVQEGTITIYMRRSFTVPDTSAIETALLDIDYDDGFIAYLNGVEVARNNVPNPANYNTTAIGEHGAVMYTGGNPERYEIPKTVLISCLVPGQNLLAVEVHNVAQNSSDMSCIPWFSLGIKDNSSNYGPTPSWFQPPFEFASTTLPIIVLNTNGQEIVDDPRITINMGIIDNGPGQLNRPADPFNNYNGNITIEFRGSSTQGFPKKQYGISTVDAQGNELNVPLLGFPPENDWILNAPYTDKTMMREYLTYNLGREMGMYTTRTRYCELVLNGQYQGVYILLEKIKWDKNRVDVPMMDANDNNGDSLSGGYLFKIDKFTGSGGLGWPSDIANFQGQNKDIYFQYMYPKPEYITPPQAEYLQTFVNNFEANLNSSNFNNPLNGYHQFIDVQSFIDFFLLNEITKNVDGYRLSTYMYKQRNSRGGKIYMGPIWDFNIALGNADYCGGDQTTGWALDFVCDLSVIPFWWHRLMQDNVYINQLHCRWTTLRQTILKTTTLMAQIDSVAGVLEEPQQRNYAVWPILGTYVWPNNFVGNTYAEEVAYFKQWLTDRLEWMDANMPTVTQPQCQSIQSGSVTVSEINYHSESSLNAGDWFEIKNVTNQPVNVSGWQFKDGSGTNSYTIPAGTIPANGYLVLCQNLFLFQQQHPAVTNVVGGFNFGFGNSGDEINLFDNLSNPVLSMAFADSAGWTHAADGYGYTLESNNPNGNLNDPTNWFPGCIGGSPGTGYTPCAHSIVFSEINYNAAPTADSQDWVELHNTTNTPIYIGNHSFLDENDTLRYAIPGGTILPANGYMVLSRDSLMFRARFPLVNNVRGSFLFGLGGGGDACRLFDGSGKLIASVVYNDELPWPLEPDGQGYTLELLNDTGKMSVGTNWFAGCPEGSPGGPYTQPCLTALTENLTANATVYPNPYTDRLMVEWNSVRAANTSVEVYDMFGKPVSSTNLKSAVGLNRFENITPAGLPAGMYLLRLVIDGQGATAIKIVKQ